MSLWHKQRRIVTLIFSLVWIAGCETYDPKPLDLESYSRLWHKRTLVSEDLAQFVQGLNTTHLISKANFDPEDGLTLIEGELVALVFNPDLRMARQQAKVTEAKIPYVGLWRDPVFNLNILNIAERIPDPWYISSSLSLTIPISGRKRAEKTLAAAEVTAQWQQVAESEWLVMRNLREQWLSWSAFKLKREQTQAMATALEKITITTDLLSQEGELLKTEARLFTIERNSTLADLDQLTGDLSVSEHGLRSFLGLSPQASIDFIPANNIHSENNNELSLSADRNPRLVRLSRDYEIAENTLLLEIRKQYPDLTLGPQLETDGGQSRNGFVGWIPFPILSGNRGDIAEAKARRELAKAALETTFEKLTGQLRGLQAKLIGLESRKKRLEAKIAPEIDQQVADAYRLLELGEGSSLVLLESLMRAYEMKLKLIDTQLAVDLTINEIQYLIGPTQTD